jgi:hypothetical protein
VPAPCRAYRSGVGEQSVACLHPADHLAHILAKGRIERVLPAVGFDDQVKDPQFHHGGSGTRGLSEGKKARGQAVEPNGERGGLGIDQPLRHSATGTGRIGDEGGDALLQLVGQPEIELVEAGEDRHLTVPSVALPLGGGAHLGLRVAGRGILSARGGNRDGALWGGARRRSRLGRATSAR